LKSILFCPKPGILSTITPPNDPDGHFNFNFEIRSSYHLQEDKAIVKRRNPGHLIFLWVVAMHVLSSAGGLFAEEPQVPGIEQEKTVPTSELDLLKIEWEEVRDQQIRMIREKEDQLEKLKEEIFAKMKTLNAPGATGAVDAKSPVAVPSAAILPVDVSGAAVLADRGEFEAQRKALQADREKFLSEIKQKETALLELQKKTDAQSKELEEERARFEQSKKSSVRS
jgi:hypothetical protein